MQKPSQKKKVQADFFAHGYRVSGAFSIINRLLADVIYDPTTNYMLLHDAYLSPIMDPAKISAYYKLTIMDKSNLDFVLTVKQRDGLRRDQHYGIAGNKFIICVTVPYFEISGDLHTTMKVFHPKSYLTTEASTFISLYNATARSTFNPDLTYEAGTILVNREKMSFFGQKT